jgi:hypothetical protein
VLIGLISFLVDRLQEKLNFQTENLQTLVLGYLQQEFISISGPGLNEGEVPLPICAGISGSPAIFLLIALLATFTATAVATTAKLMIFDP